MSEYGKKLADNVRYRFLRMTANKKQTAQECDPPAPQTHTHRQNQSLSYIYKQMLGVLDVWQHFQLFNMRTELFQNETNFFCLQKKLYTWVIYGFFFISVLWNTALLIWINKVFKYSWGSKGENRCHFWSDLGLLCNNMQLINYLNVSFHATS